MLGSVRITALLADMGRTQRTDLVDCLIFLIFFNSVDARRIS